MHKQRMWPPRIGKWIADRDGVVDQMNKTTNKASAITSASTARVLQ